ncbi:MAG: PAS domain-containing protein [Gemmatimonadales bacterium]|nr:PAS domain-containing protein [Gemmatimonadales bacterium]
MNLTGRLVLGTFAVVVCTLVVLLWGSERALRADLEVVELARLTREAQGISGALSADTSRWAAEVAEMSAQTGHRVALRSGDRLVVATDSLRSGAFLTASAPGGPGTVEVSATVRYIDDAVRRARDSTISAAVIALLVALLLAGIAGRSVASPLLEISRAAHSIAGGAPPRFPRSRIAEVDKVVAALRDMHAQLGSRFTALEREKAETAAIVESMVEGIISTDARGAIVTANATARRLLGYQAAAAMPHLATIFRVKAARDAVDRVLLGDSIIDREVELRGAVFTMNARPLPGGGAVVVLHDLTEVRRLETVRRDFVANVSHELKTPLTSIAGYAETLTDEDIAPEARQRFVGTILANARRMQHLVDDLLDLSRIESGRWTPNATRGHAATIVREAWSGFADRAAHREIQFALEVGADADQLTADGDAVHHVLCNLFDNALRHLNDGGTVRVETTRVDGGVSLAVTDTGSGIAPEHLPRIFERFYRVDPSRAREQGGTGLGLAIVKHMVEAHGGGVAIRSTVRMGTTVTAWFPDRPGATPGVTTP